MLLVVTFWKYVPVTCHVSYSNYRKFETLQSPKTDVIEIQFISKLEVLLIQLCLSSEFWENFETVSFDREMLRFLNLQTIVECVLFYFTLALLICIWRIISFLNYFRSIKSVNLTNRVKRISFCLHLYNGKIAAGLFLQFNFLIRSY